MNCPNCTSKMIKDPKHAQNVFKCEECLGIYFILNTTKPKEETT